ncbi:hypothetical protein [Yersinia aldovae]|uniref:hypothetical protein n=1 Tax=Yersinia aldovae TaxID=29483 RepID=UPI00119D8C1A|nr:hypothetical protein [Yersinia aldovae]
MLYLSIIVILVIFCVVFASISLALYQEIKCQNETIEEPDYAFSMISHWCEKVTLGKELDKLRADMLDGIRVLEQRRNSI